jgi:hypothetical protein
LLAALTQTTYSFKGDRLILESKENIKERLGYSPDKADVAALTFAHPVSPKVDLREVLRPTRCAAYYRVRSVRGGVRMGRRSNSRNRPVADLAGRPGTGSERRKLSVGLTEAGRQLRTLRLVQNLELMITAGDWWCMGCNAPRTERVAMHAVSWLLLRTNGGVEGSV